MGRSIAPSSPCSCLPQARRSGASGGNRTRRLEHHADVWRGRRGSGGRYNDLRCGGFRALTYRLSPRYGESVRVLDGKRAHAQRGARACRIQARSNKVGFIGFSAGSSPAREWARRRIGSRECGRHGRYSSRPITWFCVWTGTRDAGRSAQTARRRSWWPPRPIPGASLGAAQLFMDLTKAGGSPEIHMYQKGSTVRQRLRRVRNFSDWMARQALPQTRWLSCRVVGMKL